VRLIGLHHLLLCAPPGCQEQARAFFGGVLGLEELEKPEGLRGRGGCWFALPDGRQLHIGIEEPFVPATKAHPAFLVADYEELRAHFGAEEDERVPGVRHFYGADPFGNRLEFIKSA
jgi:catechol 2,3-dioxygenase-like lactoylglutathione lyase family enzyme